MNFQITPYKRILKTHFDPGMSHSEIISYLEQETWQDHPAAGLRKHCRNPKNTKLQEIIEFLQSDEITKQILQAQHDLNSDIFNRWDMTLDSMYHQTTTYVYFGVDYPGSHIHCHLDQLKLLFTGLTYFTNKDNELASTRFYDSPNKENLFRSTTNFGDGFMQANLHNTWHEGGNGTDELRYFLIIEIFPYITRNLNRT